MITHSEAHVHMHTHAHMLPDTSMGSISCYEVLPVKTLGQLDQII